MDLRKVLEELDSLPGGERAHETEGFLRGHIEAAKAEGDREAELALVNELIGYLRYMGKFDDAGEVIDRARNLCSDMGITGTKGHATTLLNIATLERAMGRYEKSLEDYTEVTGIYDKVLEKDDYLYAALYNNMSLLYQETGEHEKSAECLKKAIPIISARDDERIAQAISRTNLAQAYLRLNRLDEAEAELISAEDIFEKEGGNEFHYPGCLNSIADLKIRKGDIRGGVEYYGKALDLLEEKVGVDSPSYKMVAENLEAARKMLGDGTDTSSGEGSKSAAGNPETIKGMDLARNFFEEYGRAMIHEKFGEYEDRITAGLVGRGSQCYGFDDPLSRDHDFGPDFCIWLNDDLYDEIGDRLQEAYNTLPTEYMGFKRVDSIPPDGKRVGVMRTREFYARILDVSEEFLLSYTEIM